MFFAFNSNAQHCQNKIKTYLLLIQFHYFPCLSSNNNSVYVFELAGPESSNVTTGDQLKTGFIQHLEHQFKTFLRPNTTQISDLFFSILCTKKHFLGPATSSSEAE
jgi:hypothetical protein